MMLEPHSSADFLSEMKHFLSLQPESDITCPFLLRSWSHVTDLISTDICDEKTEQAVMDQTASLEPACQRADGWGSLGKQMFSPNVLCRSLGRAYVDKRHMRLRHAAHPCNSLRWVPLTSMAINVAFIGSEGRLQCWPQTAVHIAAVNMKAHTMPSSDESKSTILALVITSVCAFAKAIDQFARLDNVLHAFIM